MEDAASSSVLSVNTAPLATPSVAAADAVASPLSNELRNVPPTAQEPVRKGSQEWASPRSRGRRGTPPPIPRRGSRSDDVAGTRDLPPRPRTPAQVLASRAQAGKAAVATVASGTSGSNDAAEATPQPPEPSTAIMGSEDESNKAVEPESGPGATPADTVEEDEASVKPADQADGPERRTSLQLSVMSESDAGTEAEGEGIDGFGSFRREERGDTSTVDEESMYNDDEDGEDGDATPDEDEDDEEDDEEDEEDEDGDDHASVGMSDEYVSIFRHENEFYNEVEEDEQQRQHGDDSLTPDSTPPPSPVRSVQPPAPLASEWIKYVAESGHEYYYNSRTQVSQWARPQALLSPTAGASHEDDKEENQSQAQADEGGRGYDELPAQVPVHVVPVSRAYYAPPSTSTQQAPQPTPSYLEALFLAVTKNDETAQLQELLRYDVDVNAVNASGLTPLHVTVQYGNARGAAMLLDYGARVDGLADTSNGVRFSTIETPLVMACRTNHATLVRLLVRYGASIYTRDTDGNTVLHIAIRCWSDEVLSCLLEMDSMAAILNLRNTEDETPLHLAARHGNANAVRSLMASGASIDAEDAQGRTPLVVSIMENRVDCAQLLQLGVVAPSESQYSTRIDDTAEAEDHGVVMYDDSEEKNGAGDPEGQPSSTQPPSELESLRVYLTQLLQHSAADAVLASTVYQFMDAVQRESARTAEALSEAREREDNLLHQIDTLTNYQSAASQELAEAHEATEHLREQLDAKEHELSSLQAAYESISSRATMLESIARSSQDKLKRERVEHARQEEYWTQTIDSSLRENAALLQSVQALQQQEGWKHQEETGFAEAHATDDSTTTSHEVYEDTFDSQVADPQGYDGTGGYDACENPIATGALQPDSSFYTTTEAYDASYYSQDPSVDFTSYYSTNQGNAISTTMAQAPTIDPEAGSTTISPARVDAVWNRFFENMARVSDTGAPSQQQTLSPRSTTFSPRQATAPLPMLPPASAVFDCVRKDNKDRLHQLLLSGISPNIRDIGERGTPLHLASELGDLEAVMLLCEFGADVEIRDENGNTPLLVACSQGHFDCTKFLLQSAANQAATNASRDTALHLAAWDGSVECVAMLLEYGVDILAKNALGLTALANLKTRSPLRHRFDDLSRDHPMARTLELLEEAERLEMSDDESEKTQPSMTASKNHSIIAGKPKKTKSGEKPQSKPQPSNASWGRWLLGSVFGSASTPSLSSAAAAESDEDEAKSDFEEAESSPSAMKASGFLPDYEDLRPPPEIEAELRRKPLASPTAESLPPPPPEVLDALEKRKLGTVLSPTHSATRFASPASMATVKKPTQTTPTNVRSRYVDTFNSP